MQIFEDFIIKMMINPSPSGQPGGFGQPAGGGGKPPRKPSGSQPTDGHYVERIKLKRKRDNKSLIREHIEKKLKRPIPYQVEDRFLITYGEEHLNINE